jgi:hypothetical protein
MDPLQFCVETGNKNDVTVSIFFGGQLTGMTEQFKVFLKGTAEMNVNSSNKSFIYTSMYCRLEQQFKGTVSRDFRPLVFFVKQYPWVH